MLKFTKHISKILLFFERLIFGFLIAVFIVVASPLLPFTNIPRTYIVTTGSMEPTIPTGSIIVSKPTDTHTLEKGTVIAFKSPKDPKNIILHRIYTVKEENPRIFETKGDNNNAPDNWEVPEDSVVGIYLFSIPFLGHPAAFMRTKLGFAVMIGIPALLIIIMQLLRIKKGIDEEVEKRLAKKMKEKENENSPSIKIFIGFLLGILPLVTFFTAKTIQAFFQDTAEVYGVSLSVKDFVPPEKPTNLHWKNPDVACGGTTNSYTITADWDDTIDIGGSGIDHYEYNITYPKIGGGTGNWTTTVTPSQYSGVFNADNGIHTYKVRAWDKEGNVSEWSNECTIYYDTKAPTVSIGNGNDGTTRYNSSTLPQPIVNSPTNTGGPTHDSHVSGTVPLYATAYDPHMMRYHFRIIRDGETESGKDWSAGNGYFFGGYIFTAVVNANLGTNTPVINLDTTKLTDGVYWLIIGARDTLGHRNATNADQDPRIKIIVDNTKPTATLSVTGSPTKIVEENVENGSFESGTDGWTTTNDVLTKSSETISGSTITPTDQSQMIRIGDTSGTAGNYTWSNRLMQSIPAGARTLSFMYNFFTRDSFYDDPGMFVRINGTDAFHMSSWMINPSGASLASSGWEQFVYDISYITDPFINLTISAGNTGDKTKQSWVYIDNVTTYYVAAPAAATYEIVNSETGKAYYRISPTTDFTLYTTPFSLPVSGTYTLDYYTEDTAGNKSGVRTATIVTDADPPAPASDMAVIDKSANSLTLTWTAPGDDGMTGRASRYDLCYSTNLINDSTFDQATAAATISSPTISGEKETMRIEGLNPDTTYFVGLKVYDDAGNSSTLVTVSGKTDTGDPANPGDVIINEMIWKGTSVSIYDEWIELRNKTDRVIDISGWQLTKYLTDTTDTVMYTFPAKSYIQPHGYIVIAEYDEVNSALIKEPDFVNGSGSSNDGNFGLSDTHLRIQLLDGSGTLIDIAWDGSAAPTMYHQPGYNYSMERMESPGNGNEKIRWYPCIDEASRTEFFDGTGIDYGTPGAKNRSENEPVVYEFLKTTTASATIQEPTLTLTHDEKLHTASFTVVNIQEYTTLSWELSYDTDPSMDSKSDSVTQGAIGKVNLTGSSEYQKEGILLGTCTANGTCTYHTGVTDLKLTVTLKTVDGNEVVLENIL